MLANQNILTSAVHCPHIFSGALFASDVVPKFHERLTHDSGISSKACLPVQQKDPFSPDKAREASTEPQEAHSMLSLKHVQGLFLTRWKKFMRQIISPVDHDGNARRQNCSIRLLTLYYVRCNKEHYIFIVPSPKNTKHTTRTRTQTPPPSPLMNTRPLATHQQYILSVLTIFKNQGWD